MSPTSSFLKQSLYEPNSAFCLSLLCFISVFLVLKLTRRNKLNLPPSPPKLPIIGNLHQLGTLPHRTFQTLSHKYGPLMMLQLGQTPTLVVSSANIVREMIKTHDVAFSNRFQPTTAKLLLYGCKDVGFSPYDKECKEKKKTFVMELLSLQKVRSYHSIRQEEAVELVDSVREKARASSESYVNLSEMMTAAASNIVSRCVFGRKCDECDGFGELERKVMSLLAAFSVGDFFPSLAWIDVLTGLIPEIKATFAALDAFFEEVITDHETKNHNGSDDHSHDNDFVGILLRLKDCGKLEYDLTRDTLKSFLMDMVIGGGDTTSTILEWAFAELLRNSNTMKKAQEEVRRVVGSNPKVDESDVNQMNYLKCVIKETLRTHPAAPLLVPRETTSNVKLQGYDIPSKTKVIINAWAIQRDPEFWDKPDEFIPERFESSQVNVTGQDFQLIPFGTGRRRCPGISFGLASTELILANLLYWFDWKMPKTDAMMQEIDMSETNGLSVRKKVPLTLEPIPYSFGFKP